MADKFIDLGHTKVDLSRTARQGLDEVVFGAGKSAAELLSILKAMVEHSGRAMATGVDAEKAGWVQERLDQTEWDEVSKVLSIGSYEQRSVGKVNLVSAGTSDSFVMKEAARTLEFFGYHYEIIVDVGVAGIHRLMAKLDEIRDCNVVICFAGMEGALPSVLAGLVDVPVVAVPTSVGAGISKGGRVAMESMLSSCSPGIAVVNIDNGFGAAMFAAKVINQIAKIR